MKRHKRDRQAKLFNRGFQAGLNGKSRDTCPVHSTELRSQWMSGWREGREALWSGMNGVSSIQANPSLH
ncbi:MAG: ribosome modulation factor [Pontibacterium sp.]